MSEQSLLDMAQQWGEVPEWMLLNSRGAQDRSGAGLATASEVRILVLPGDKTWLAETYATLKAAHAAWTGGTWLVLVEGAEPEGAQRLYHSLRDTAMRFLGIAPAYLGCLPRHKEVGGGLEEGLHAGLLAESLQGVQLDHAIEFEQYWQRLWLFSRMAADSSGGNRGNAGRYPG